MKMTIKFAHIFAFCYFLYSHIYHSYPVRHVRHISIHLWWTIKLFWLWILLYLTDTQLKPYVIQRLTYSTDVLKRLQQFHHEDKSGCLKWFVVNQLNVMCAHCASQTSHTINTRWAREKTRHTVQCVCFWYWIFTQCLIWWQ